MYGSIVFVINIGKNITPGAKVLEILHVQDVHDHLVDDLGLAIRLGLEGSGIGELGVQQ
jgi:hypothetical protein